MNIGEDTPGAKRRRELLRQEAILAFLINAAISIGFYLVVFGWSPVGARELATDFLPQSAGVAIVGGLMPSLITFAKIAGGKVLPAGTVPTKSRQLFRVAVMALFAVTVFGFIALLLTMCLAPPVIAPLSAMLLKAAYGGLLGCFVALPLVRSALGMPLY